MSGARSAGATPFTILTGFLGAGKTTVLNRMLRAPKGRRIAVLVNELGRVAIDSKLIVGRGGDVLELAGGCVCCSVDVKNDLWDGIADVVRRSRPDAVVLETTGIAEPGAILDGLARGLPDAAGETVEAAGVVCVVDCDAGGLYLDRREEAVRQIESADRLLLSKLDIAPAPAVAETHRRLDALNRRAERASFPATAEGTAALVPWVLERRGVAGREGSGDRHAHRQGQLTAVAFMDDAPLLEAPLLELVNALSERLVRLKGFVYLAGDDRRGFLELAGVRTSLARGAPWGDEAPRTELVFIGEDLDEAALRRRLWACRAGGGA